MRYLCLNSGRNVRDEIIRNWQTEVFEYSPRRFVGKKFLKKFVPLYALAFRKVGFGHNITYYPVH